MHTNVLKLRISKNVIVFQLVMAVEPDGGKNGPWRVFVDLQKASPEVGLASGSGNAVITGSYP